MLTPVDIQQKKFHIGLGYEKKDVNAFFDEVTRNYEELYRTNAELKEQINTLTDGLQNYKSKEDALEKSLMRAEKDSEDKKSSATKEAKSIVLDARIKAKAIIGDAEDRLAAIKDEIALLETQYAAYKANFCNLMKKQFEFLGENDFDADSYIDEKALGVLIGATAPVSSEGSFGAFNGDPQMRDESSLGGMNSGYGYGRESLTSTSAVYTAHLGANQNFVDPFNPNKDNGRYNPYDGSHQKGKKSTDKESSFKVANSSKNKTKYKKPPVDTKPENKTENKSQSKTESASTPSVKQNSEEKKKDTSSASTFTSSQTKAQATNTVDTVRTDAKKSDSVISASIDANDTKTKKDIGTIPTVDAAENVKNKAVDAAEIKNTKSVDVAEAEDAKSVDTPDISDDISLSGEVEVKVEGVSLIEDGTEVSDSDTDEFGFEFI